jgi:hypothetical protein
LAAEAAASAGSKSKDVSTSTKILAPLSNATNTRKRAKQT